MTQTMLFDLQLRNINSRIIQDFGENEPFEADSLEHARVIVMQNLRDHGCDLKNFKNHMVRLKQI
jgi:hypothetical protein